VFLPGHGMLGASLRHRGDELLRRVADLSAAALSGSTAGIPLLYPWANRLATARFMAAGTPVELDPDSPLLRRDERGLLNHGVPWARLRWRLVHASETDIVARLQWAGRELLSVFPFPHSLELSATLRPGGLTIRTTVFAAPDSALPVSFGFHPYLGIPGLPRASWQLSLPPMRRLLLDDRRIPTGNEESFGGFQGELGGHTFDDGFAIEGDKATLKISGAGRRIEVELLSGFSHVQVFAPPGQDLIALEPMTAPANALASGRGLRVIEPRGRFDAEFRISVAPIP
jgi:aldose 1-epimerase